MARTKTLNNKVLYSELAIVGANRELTDIDAIANMARFQSELLENAALNIDDVHVLLVAVGSELRIKMFAEPTYDSTYAFDEMFALVFNLASEFGINIEQLAHSNAPTADEILMDECASDFDHTIEYIRQTSEPEAAPVQKKRAVLQIQPEPIKEQEPEPKSVKAQEPKPTIRPARKPLVQNKLGKKKGVPVVPVVDFEDEDDLDFDEEE